VEIPSARYNFHFPDGTMDPGVNERPGAIIQQDEHLRLRGSEWIVTDLRDSTEDGVDFDVHVEPVDDEPSPG
jgi:hypothetical protein